MDSFSFQLDRLKQALGVKEDQEVASALGLSRAALSERKRRGSFPVDKLKVLAAQRPDEVNVYFVLNGPGIDSDVGRPVTQLVESKRGRFAPPLDAAHLSRVIESVQREASERGVELDTNGLAVVAGGVYNTQPVGAEPNQALVRAMLDVYLQTQAASRRAEAKGH